MGYYMQAFIGEVGSLEPIAAAYDRARIIALEKRMAIIPMIEELCDDMNGPEPSGQVGPFTYLTTGIERRVLALMPSATFGYIEAEYHGGQGAQFAVLWKDGKRIQVFSSPRSINALLQALGLMADAGKDEFDTAGLDRHRHLEDWLEEL
jgi:hypothetical protein